MCGAQPAGRAPSAFAVWVPFLSLLLLSSSQSPCHLCPLLGHGESFLTGPPADFSPPYAGISHLSVLPLLCLKPFETPSFTNPARV